MRDVGTYATRGQHAQYGVDIAELNSVRTQVPGHIYLEVSKWVRDAPVAHKGKYGDVAKQVIEAWENPHNDVLKILNPYITSLPAMPPHLRRLDFSFCGSLHTPPNLMYSTKLEDVDFTHCEQLSALPELKYCIQLKKLTFKGCKKLSNVDALGRCLSARFVDLWGCLQVTSLPDFSRCTSLRSLNLELVPITSLRDNFFTLPCECRVNMNASQMSARLRDLISSVVNASDYSGPQIDFHMDEIDGVEELPLEEEVESWLQENDNAELVDTSKWQKIQSEENGSQFSQFLGRIRETSEYKIQKLRPEALRRVVNLLRNIEQPGNDSLRRTCFLIAEDALGTCGDRIALSLMKMEMAMVGHQAEHDVDSGSYDNNMANLVELGKGMFRMDLLSDLARKKAATLRFVDQIEVHLGYLVGMSTKFQLPVQMKTMLYPKCSEITRRDLDDAVIRLGDFSAHDHVEWKSFLASWTPMDKLLKRTFGESASGMQEEQIAAMMSAERQRLYVSLERLDDNDKNYTRNAKSLMEEYNKLPQEIAIRAKEKKMEALLMRLNIRW